jgi:predicted RNA-binding Zn ribbon-like protein
MQTRMTGEEGNIVPGENIDVVAPQPGGRQPAPDRLAIVQAFVNTYYDLADGGEVLSTPAALEDWLARRDLFSRRCTLDRHDLERAVAVREGMRALAFSNNGRELDQQAIDAMRRASKGAGTEIRLGPDGPEFLTRHATNLDGPLGALLAISATAMIDGSWSHLKACLGRDCGWVFYDRSRNQSARWCAMHVCGDREKSRAHYRRKTIDAD